MKTFSRHNTFHKKVAVSIICEGRGEEVAQRNKTVFEKFSSLTSQTGREKAESVREDQDDRRLLNSYTPRCNYSSVLLERRLGASLSNRSTKIQTSEGTTDSRRDICTSGSKTKLGEQQK